MFYPDVQARGEYPTYMVKYFADNDIKLDIEEQDEQILKEGIVDFVAISYYMSHVAEAREDAAELAGTFDSPIKMSIWSYHNGIGQLIQWVCAFH